MDSATAARYLHPRAFVIALSAATATLGDLDPSIFPSLYGLIADEVGIPHSVRLPTATASNKQASPRRSFADILYIVQQVQFTPDAHMAKQHALNFSHPRVRTLDYALRIILDAVLRCPDGLSLATELMEPQTDAAMHGLYEPDGLIACFLRKVVVALSCLSFEALCRLLHDLRQYVDPDRDSAQSSYTPRTLSPGPAVSQKVAFDLAHGIATESEEDFRISTQIFSESRRPVTATNAAIHSLQTQNNGQSNLALPMPEYVAQLEAQRRRDFATSVDALHRYFDLSLGELGRKSTEAHARQAQDDRDSSSGTANELQGHQYAALSLGILHASFGNSSFASVALDDTIRAAQQCGDNNCQASALNWIARTSPSVAKRHQLLRHANDNLALAREEICTVFTPTSDSVPDSVHLDYSTRKSRGESDNSRTEGVPRKESSKRLARIRNRLKHTNPDDRVESLLMSAAAWESHAASRTALLVAETALSLARRKHKERLSSSKARAITAVASLLAREGHFSKAEVLLTENGGRDSAVPSPLSTNAATSTPEIELLSRCLTWLRFESALLKRDVSEAERLLDVLTGYEVCARTSSISLLTEDIVLDAIEAKCRFQLTIEASKEAAQEANVLCRRAARLAKPGRVIEALRLRAEAHLQSESYSSALPVALAAVSLSNGLGLESANVRCVLTLTEVILRMEEESFVTDAHALNALTPVLAKALGGMGASVRARAYRLHAECLLAKASASRASPNKHVVEILERALEAYTSVGDACGIRDSLYILARVYHWQGDFAARNAAACKYNEQTKLMSMKRSCLTA